jgi:hypothetical protein
MINTVGATCGTGPAYLLGTPAFSPDILIASMLLMFIFSVFG